MVIHLTLRRRLQIVSAVVAATALALSLGHIAFAKEGIKARLTTPLPVDARPGQKLTLEWTLAGTDQDGNQRPFNAMGVFVRLESASGSASTMGFATATAHPDGRYSAQVDVPSGGIGGIEIGVRGSTDLIFPLENDPLPARPTGPVLSRKGSTSSSNTMIVVALASIIAVVAVLSGMLGVARLRRKAAASLQH